ncbi:MAG: cellulase family glycosylhydrolase, partial [Acutalibacteraceae bacterium]|nr:cellulase family glycosylhydrolase [Acutalibacteraceae bacterium]
MINSVVAFFTAIFTFFSGCFSGFVDAVFFPEPPQTESVEFAKKLGNGWNLGNALDACEMGSDEKLGLESETHWGNPYTTKEMIEAVKNAGFSTVRIPITWAQHLDENYVIDEAWLARVKQIVDWVLECEMYAIINVHHDDTFWLVTDKAHEENATAVLTAIWSQVSEYFRVYDE